MGRFFQKRWAVQALALLVMLSVLITAAAALLSGVRAAWGAAVGFWLIYLLGLGISFSWFRRKRAQERKEEA